MGTAAPGLVALAALTGFTLLFLWVESEIAVAALLGAGAAAVLLAARLGWLRAGRDQLRAGTRRS